MMKTRQAYKWNNEVWQTIEFKDLKQKDIFYLTESTGELVQDEEYNYIFIGLGDAFLNEDGIWTINTEVYESKIPSGVKE